MKYADIRIRQGAVVGGSENERALNISGSIVEHKNITRNKGWNMAPPLFLCVLLQNRSFGWCERLI